MMNEIQGRKIIAFSIPHEFIFHGELIEIFRQIKTRSSPAARYAFFTCRLLRLIRLHEIVISTTFQGL